MCTVDAWPCKRAAATTAQQHVWHLILWQQRTTKRAQRDEQCSW